MNLSELRQRLAQPRIRLIAGRLMRRVPLESAPSLMSLSSDQFAYEQGELWVTIGGGEEKRGGKTVKHAGGTPVKIDREGKIHAGPPALKGKKIDELSNQSENRSMSRNDNASSQTSGTKEVKASAYHDTISDPHKPRWEFHSKEVTDGDRVRVRDDENARTVEGTARQKRWSDGSPDAGRFYLEDAKKTDDPMPPVSPEGKIELPESISHAHFRSWRKGDVVKVHGQAWNVVSVGKSRLGREYTLAPATEEQYAKRPGRKSLSADSADDAEHQIGNVIPVGNEWLHIKKIEGKRFSGGGLRGVTYVGIGNYVPEARAKKLKEAWEKKDKVRKLELTLRDASGSESMYSPEDIAALKEQLSQAKREAGI